MEILIRESIQAETGTNGYSVQLVLKNGKKRTDEADFFQDGSEIETKIQQLKRLLRQHFDANP